MKTSNIKAERERKRGKESKQVKSKIKNTKIEENIVEFAKEKQKKFAGSNKAHKHAFRWANAKIFMQMFACMYVCM